MDIALRSVRPGDEALPAAWVDRPDSPLGKPEADGADRDIEIIERAGAPVGQISLQRQGDAFAVDIYVEPKHRRGGIARAALVETLAKHGAEHPNAVYLAAVDPDNDGARKFFAMLGFSFDGEDGARIRYRRRAVDADIGSLRAILGRPRRD